jgi:hypothetical protein
MPDYPNFRDVLEERRCGGAEETTEARQEFGPSFPVFKRLLTERAERNFGFVWTEEGHYSSGGYYGGMDFFRLQLKDRVIMLASMEGRVVLATLQTARCPQPVPVPVTEENLLALVEP